MVTKNENKGGAILVFLPGMQEISTLQKVMMRDPEMCQSSLYRYVSVKLMDAVILTHIMYI
jgi:HrpA-like RNA helicase